VLIYPNKDPKLETDVKKRKILERQAINRGKFMDLLNQQGFSSQTDKNEEHVFVKLHCSFKRLCVEAERCNIEMPLKKLESEALKKKMSKRIMIGINEGWLTNEDDDPQGCIGRIQEKYFETDGDVVDYVSCAFNMNKIDKYENWEDPTNFFRPSLRSLLVYHILINIDIRNQAELEGTDGEEEDETCSCLPGPLRSMLCCCLSGSDAPSRPKTAEDGQVNKALKKRGLPWLLVRGAYTDYLVLHEDSVKNSQGLHKTSDQFITAEEKLNEKVLEYDPRKKLDETWTRVFKFQPLWYIREYFGEKIGFYFAWIGLLCATLWIPTIFGLLCFFYGLHVSMNSDDPLVNTTRYSLFRNVEAQKCHIGLRVGCRPV